MSETIRVADGVEVKFYPTDGSEPLHIDDYGVWASEFACVGSWLLSLQRLSGWGGEYWDWVIHLKLPYGQQVCIDYGDHPLRAQPLPQHKDIELARKDLLERWSDIMKRNREHRPLFDVEEM